MTEELRGLLRDVLEDLQKRQEAGRADKARQAWCSAVGARAAGHSEIVYLTKDKIRVNVETSAWLHALNLKRESLEKKLQTTLGPVRLMLRLGPVKKDGADRKRECL